MVIDIKMCRFDNVPWGFRLVGGADYEYPLTVVKVMEGSIAEEAGLCEEDVIVRINDTAATPLTHDEAHRLIMNSGSVFYFGVYREHEEEACMGPMRFPVSSGSLTKSPTPTPSPTFGESATPTTTASASPLPTLTEATKAFIPEQEQPEAAELETALQANVELECPSGITEMHSDGYSQSEGIASTVDRLYLPELPDRPCSAMSEQTEIKLVEEEIAAVLSGESEVLKEHNVLGVNFYRIFPKPGVCMTSDVLRSLNEEVTKTKLEKEKENRKWSTFLQRPDRPIPKSKQQLEAERRAANAYKVKIVKSAPRDKSPMPEAKPAAKEATPPPTPTPKEATPPTAEQVEAEEMDEEPLPLDSEVPNLEQLPNNGSNELVEFAESPEEAEGEQLEKTDASKEEPEEQTTAEPNEQQQQSSEELTTADITPPKTDEELALEKQLADVQKQLAALSTLPSTIQSTLDAVTKQLAELLPTFKLQQQNQEQEQEQKQEPQIDETEGQAPGQQASGENEGVTISVAGPDNPEQKLNETAAGTPSENNENKCDANDLEVAEISHLNGDNRELDAQLNVEQSFKKQKIAFWNRLFNGEHITRQRFRELQSQSVAKSTHRVNFMKYQKPERKIDLNRSEVYKVIHHLDRAPVRGIEVRAPLVAAESDIRQALQS